MTHANRSPDFSRRSFLAGTVSFVAGTVVIAPGCGDDQNQSSTTDTDKPATTRLFSAFQIKAVVPGRLVFPTPHTNRRPTELVAVRMPPGQSSATFQFSMGRSVTYDTATSFHDEVRKRNGKANRECVVPKLLAAYILDATHRTVRRYRAKFAFNRQNAPAQEQDAYARELDYLQRLKLDFEKLQEQPVLDNVSGGALYELLDNIESHLLYRYENHLRNTFARLDLVGLVATIPDRNEDLPLVIRINEARQIAKNQAVLVA